MLWKYFKLFLFLNLSLITSCVSPRLWIVSRTDNDGIIGYQNYNPKSDGGKRISELVHCKNHTMTSNPIKQGYAHPTVYQSYNSGYGMTTIYPVDGGSYEWAEYHYRCNSKFSENTNEIFISSRASMNSKLTENEAKMICEEMYNKGELVVGMTIKDCESRLANK